MKIRCVNWASQETDAEMDVGGEEISFFLFYSLLTNSYMYVLVAQSCPTLCNTKDCSLPGSSVHGILQARILECVACPPPGDLPDLGIEPGSPILWADCLLSEPPGKTN